MEQYGATTMLHALLLPLLLLLLPLLLLLQPRLLPRTVSGA